jgi:hypothetical protein
MSAAGAPQQLDVDFFVSGAHRAWRWREVDTDLFLFGRGCFVGFG